MARPGARDHGPCWALLPLGALALVAALDAWRAGRRRRVIATGLALVAVWLAMHRPLPPGVLRVRAVDDQAAWYFWARPRFESAQARRDHGAVAAAMRDFLRGEPGDLDAPDPQARHARRQIRMVYTRAHDVLAQAALERGDTREAAAERQSAPPRSRASPANASRKASTRGWRRAPLPAASPVFAIDHRRTVA